MNRYPAKTASDGLAHKYHASFSLRTITTLNADSPIAYPQPFYSKGVFKCSSLKSQLLQIQAI
jgi:hypothetical protein